MLVDSITLTGADVWNAGSELAVAAHAAFLEVGTNADRFDENGTIEFSTSELVAYHNLTTAAGYNFDSTLIGNDTEIYPISFNVVPEPDSALMAIFPAFGLLLVRRKRRPA